jgi:hypothetical protein
MPKMRSGNLVSTYFVIIYMSLISTVGPIIPIKTYDTSSPLDYDDPEEIYVRENADIM